MKTISPLSIYLRIACLSLFIALLGFTPIPRSASKLSVEAGQAIIAGDPQTAASKLAALASYFPWRYELNLTAGRYAFQAGDFKSAIQYFERPGTISQLSQADLLMLGDAYLQIDNPTMAAAIWKHVIELGDELPAVQRLVEMYLKQKDYLSAAEYLQQMLTLDPSNTRLYYQTGELLAISDPTKALPFLAQAAELTTTDAGNAKTLHDKIRTTSLFDEPAYTELVVGRQLADWGEWELAKQAFQRAVTLRPDYADAWAFLGEAKQQVTRQETGADSDLGLQELELALQLDHSSVLAHMLMGIYWERQVDYQQALQYIEKAITLSPQDPYLYTELGNVLSKAGDLPPAQAAYEMAIQISPGEPLFYRQLAQFAMDNQIQIRELALPAAREALLLNPKDANSLDVMAQVMLMLMDYQSAERYALSAIQSDPELAQAYLHLGTAYLYQGQAEKAYQWLGKAETIDASSWVAAQAKRLLEYYFPK